MNIDEFEAIFNNQVELCRETLIRKGKEYADNEDRLINFKVAAALQACTPRAALGGMLAKHIVSVYDLVNEDHVSNLDLWNEKLGDALNYLFLLKACVIEELASDYINPIQEAQFGVSTSTSSTGST